MVYTFQVNGYIKYRNSFLTLFGQEYDGLERMVNDSWNPFKLPRA